MMSSIVLNRGRGNKIFNIVLKNAPINVFPYSCYAAGEVCSRFCPVTKAQPLNCLVLAQQPQLPPSTADQPSHHRWSPRGARNQAHTPSYLLGKPSQFLTNYLFLIMILDKSKVLQILHHLGKNK